MSHFGMIAQMLQPHSNLALTLLYAFGLCVIKCSFYCLYHPVCNLQLKNKVVVMEEEKETVK